MIRDDDPMQAEGAELRIGASGPLPPGAAEHLRSLIERAMRPLPDLRLIGAEDVANDDFAADNPVVASAFAAAEEELAEIERKAAEREAQIQAGRTDEAADAPPPADSPARDAALAELEHKIIQIVRDATLLGVHFRAETASDESH